MNENDYYNIRTYWLIEKFALLKIGTVNSDASNIYYKSSMDSDIDSNAPVVAFCAK